MNSAKQLIILTPGFPENESDENCIPLLQVYVKALHKTRADLHVSVIAFHYPFNSQAYSWHGIPVYPMKGRNKKGPARIITWLKVWRQLKRMGASQMQTVLHSIWLNECYWLGSLFSKFHKTKHLATVLGQDAKRENLYLRLWKDKSCTVICCSEFAATILEKEQGIPCKAIVPLGVDSMEFQNVEQSNRTIDIIGVGNLGPIKRYDVFVKVIAELTKIKPDLYAEIIGDGEFKYALQKRIDELGISKNIKLIGGIPRSGVLNRMKQSKLLLHCSSYEGQGYVYLEALASGCKVVALNRGFLPASEKVMAVEKDEELAQACLHMLNSPSDYRSFIPAPVEQTVSHYLELYNI